MKDFKSYFERRFMIGSLRYHRLTLFFENDCLRFRAKLYRRVFCLKFSDLNQFSDSDILYYCFISDKCVHIFYINYNKLNYETKKKKKISSRPSA